MTTYSLNETLIFNQEQCTLHIQHQTFDLDYKLSMLLAFFIEHQGQLVSREKILESVWPDTIVNDNTINWSISQLRKALGDSAIDAQFIKTVPKKGYKFIATISAHPLDKLEKQSIENSQQLIVKIAIGVFFLLIVTLAIGWITKAEWLKKTQAMLTEIQPFTTLDGMESSPVLLSDQQTLIYLHKTSGNANNQLRLQPLKEHAYFNVNTQEGETEQKRSQRILPSRIISNDNFDYRHLSAGLDGYNFFAVRLFNNNEIEPRKCQIVQLTLTADREALERTQNISDCHGDGWSKIAYHEASNRLFYTDRSDNDLYAVFSVDLSTQQKHQHSFPTESGLGDHFIDMSLKQDKLLILRDQQNVKTSFLVMNIASDTFEKALEIDDFYYSAHFNPSGTAIWHNWGNAIVRHQPLNKQAPYDILTTNFGWNYDAKPLSESLAVFNVSDSNDGDLLIWDEQVLKRQKNTAKESLPTISDDKYAFVSKRSGLPQIWLKSGEKPMQQLSNLTQYQPFQDLSLSPSGKFIAGVNHQTIGLINLNDNSYRALNKQQYFARNLSWSNNGEKLYFSEHKNGQWLSYEIKLNASAKPPSKLPLSDAQFVQEDNGGELLYSHSLQNGLYRYDQINNISNQLLPNFPKGTFWQRIENNIYFIQQQPVRGLFVTPLTEYTPKLVLNLPPNTLSRFAVDAQAKLFIFENISRSQTNLKLSKITNPN